MSPASSKTWERPSPEHRTAAGAISLRGARGALRLVVRHRRRASPVRQRGRLPTSSRRFVALAARSRDGEHRRLASSHDNSHP